MHKNVIIVVIKQIKRKGIMIDVKMPRYFMIETVTGINKRDKFSKRKTARSFICDVLTILQNRHKKRIIRAKTFPGKEKGKSKDNRSPMRQINNMITI